jgi:hypothetical protein
VHHELHNNNWIKNISDMTNPNQLDEFVVRYLATYVAPLSDQKDEIIWI